MGDENRGGFERDHALWAFGSLCALHQKAFAPDLLAREMPVDADGRVESGVLLSMGESLGFRVKKVSYGERSLAKLQFPLLVELKEEGAHAYGVRLLKAFEQLAKNRKVIEINFGVNSVDDEAELARLSKFAQRMGYRVVGTNFSKLSQDGAA